MNKQVRVNIKTLVNAAAIREETRDGRKVMIVPSATLPDNIVMNGIRYPAEKIAASFGGLEGSLAPLGHPKNEAGGFLAANTPRALSRNYIGAWNENVRREKGRVLMDKVIDIEVASSLPGGRKVLEAIKKGQPIHTSTGLLAKLIPLENDSEAKFMVGDMVFDHDAILLDEPGAATPEQGVGMLVNGVQIEVINSELQEQADRRLDYAIEEVVRAMETQAKVPLAQKIKDTLLALFKMPAAEEEETEPVNNEGNIMPDDKPNPFEERMNALETKINKLTGEDVAQQLTNLNERFKKMDEEAAAKSAADKSSLETEVVNAKLLSEAEAKAASAEILRALVNAAEKLKPEQKSAAPIIGHYLNSRSGSEDLAAQFPSEE